MSRLVVPVIGRTLWHTGDLLLRADLDLFLRDSPGKWPRRTFRVDSGTEATTMPAYDAKRLGQLRFSFDRDATASAPYGSMTVEKKTP